MDTHPPAARIPSRLAATQRTFGAGGIVDTDHQYDERGNLTGYTQTVTLSGPLAGSGLSPAPFPISHTYDPADWVISTTYPSGRIVTWSRDGEGRVTEVRTRAAAGAPEQVLASAITHEPFGPARTWTLGNGLTVSTSRDADGRITTRSAGSALDLAWTWTPRNEVAAITDTGSTATNRSYAYDAIGRLVDAAIGATTEAFTYDANGNRLSHVMTDGITTRTATTDLYGTNDGAAEDTQRLWEVTVTATGEAAATWRFPSAPDGSLLAKRDLATNDDAWTQGQDDDPHHELDRIAGRDAQGALASRHLIVNAFSQRVSEVRAAVGGSPAQALRHYIHTPQGELLAEHDGQDGSVLREYVWLDGEPLAVFTPEESHAGPHWYLNDHLGTPQVLVDGSQTVTWKARYEAFGKADVQVATVTQNLRFPGQYFDAETGLHYNWNRWYDPTTGRYLQADPIGLDGGINTYAYVEGDPVSLVDPTGEFGVPGAVIGGGVELGLQLLLNGGNFKCVDWWAVGVAGASGAVGGAALGGVFKLSKGSMKWENVRRRYRLGHDVPGSQDVHHWALERNGAASRQLDRLVGRETRDAIVNHPANLHAIDRAMHQGVHNSLGPLGRWWYGTPDWAKALQGSAGVGAAGEAMQGCECSR